MEAGIWTVEVEFFYVPFPVHGQGRRDEGGTRGNPSAFPGLQTEQLTGHGPRYI